jgi:hypothetical protein
LRNSDELAVQLALLIDGAWIAAGTFRDADYSVMKVAPAVSRKRIANGDDDTSGDS